jgi:hypothetical protein
MQKVICIVKENKNLYLTAWPVKNSYPEIQGAPSPVAVWAGFPEATSLAWHINLKNII